MPSSEVALQQLYQHCYNQPDNVMAFKIDKTRIEEGRSFSAEAIQLLREELLIFLGARLCKHWEQTGQPPVHMTALVTVTFDTEQERTA
jgi:hypothetical protein